MSDTPATPAPIESPPPTPRPVDGPVPDSRQVLHRLAAELMRTQNRKLLVEFLQLRRALS